MCIYQYDQSYMYICANIYICVYIHIYKDRERAKTRNRQVEKIHRLGQASDARDLHAWEAYGENCVYFHAQFMHGSCARGWPNNMDVNHDSGWDRKAKHSKQ